MTVADLVRPLLAGVPAGWHGLPVLPADALDAVLGAPAAVDAADLGYYPAERRAYRHDGGETLVWARDGRIVMIETQAALPASALDALGEPSAVLPNELLVEGGYAHEYLFCAPGLVATVVQAYAGGENRIIRLRGIAPIETPSDFGPSLYKAFEDRVHWRAE